MSKVLGLKPDFKPALDQAKLLLEYVLFKTISPFYFMNILLIYFSGVTLFLFMDKNIKINHPFSHNMTK